MKFSYNFLNKLLMLLILSYQPYNYCPFELCKGKNIIEAAQNGKFAVVQCCIARGDNVNIADKNGYSPLMKASLKGYGDIVDLLIKAGAHIDAASKDGATALRFAASRGRNDIVDLLIKAGAHVNAAPLRSAAHYGYNDTVNLLNTSPCKSKRYF